MIEDEREFWNQHVAPAYRGLYEGRGWTWDEQRQGYKSDTGSYLVGADMDALVRAILISTEFGLERETQKLLLSDSDVAAWKARMRNEVTTMMIVLGFFASGDEPDERIQKIVNGEESTDETPGYGIADARMRLDRFVDELRDGDAGTSKQVLNRAGQYARGGWEVYQQARRVSHQDAKDQYGRKVNLFEKNRLDPSCTHCSPTKFTPGCPQITALGWRPIGTLPRIGHRTCAQSCRCSWDFDLLPDDLNLEEQEHQ